MKSNIYWHLSFQKVDKFSSYPVYHSVYETYEIVEKFYDPTFKNHLAVAQVRGGLVFELADAVTLPFDCRDYAKALNSYVDIIYNLTMKYPAAMEAHNVSLGKQTNLQHQGRIFNNTQHSSPIPLIYLLWKWVLMQSVKNKIWPLQNNRVTELEWTLEVF